MHARLLTFADALLIFCSIVVIGYLFSRFFVAGPAQVAVITDHHGQHQHINLNRDQHLSVQGLLGKSQLQVAHGRLRFTDSPCTNKLCIHSGWIQYGGETVACLPNRLSVQLASNDHDFDAINF